MAEHDEIEVKEARQWSEGELRTLLAKRREEAQTMRFKHALGQLRENHKLRVSRRDIARLETILGERQRA